MYQPQPDSMEGNTVTARTAVSVQGKDQKEPVFGAVFFTVKLDIDREKDTARVISAKVDRVRFPDVKPDDPRAQKLAALLEKEIPRLDLELSLGELITALEPPPGGDKGMKNDPPVVVVRTEPAILVTFDGPPKTQSIPNTKLKRVVNTAFPIVQDTDGRYYLYGSLIWFSTKDLLSENWKLEDKPPKDIAKLFEDPNQQAKPPDAGEGFSKEELKKAKILTATKPTELIVIEGEPKYKPLVEGEVLYVENTEDYLFKEVATQKNFTVLSGRWYSAPTYQGPWTFVFPDTLPKSFAKIPKTSPKAGALAHVPGTEESKDALMDAIIPQTASVKKGPAKFEAKYDGEPKFEPIEGTKLKYAVNTASQIILADGKYFACEQGIWFVSDKPTGPWKVSETRPVGIDDIPPSSPVYNTKYVYIYDETPETVIVGYTPGYTWVYPYYGTVVYGTGWYYPPWYGVYYYPRPVTYGFHVHYSPYTGWGFGMSWSVGWFTMSIGWGGGWGGWYAPIHGPSYGAGFRAGYWAGSNNGYFGPGGYHPRVDPYRGGQAGQGRPGGGTASQLPAGGANRPSQQPAGGGPSASQRPANMYNKPENANLGARPAQRPSAGTGAPSAGTLPGGGSSMRPTPSQLPNNVYAGADGSVGRYEGGSWQTRDQGGWSSGSGTSGARPSQQPSAGGGSGTQRPAQQPSGGAGTGSSTQRPAQQPSSSSRPSSYNSSSPRGGSSYNAAAASRSRSSSYSRPSGGARGGGGGRGRGNDWESEVPTPRSPSQR